MAYIYKITNNINGKIYVGKTEFCVEKRFKEHCNDSKRRKNEKRPLYFAMKKYGIENFSIEILEETDNPSEREIYRIKELNSFKEGYNATTGGDGKKFINYDLVVEKYNEVKNIKRTSEILGISKDTVSNVLKQYNIKVEIPNQRSINQFSSNGEYIQTFKSIHDAGRYLIKNKETKSTSLNSVRNMISKCLNEQRETFCGYIWKYNNMNKNSYEEIGVFSV